MPIGTVKWFNAKKGYDFIASDDLQEGRDGRQIAADLALA
ncbi:cold shock domain-containing protein (plasmid) [Salipiger sp. H15]|uniref:Cold shock domain-containing protein n=1 Tax=Alloyangia sp. H15 TaxID=3029062 RepID=A0AAU8ATX0_9RHOB